MSRRRFAILVSLALALGLGRADEARADTVARLRDEASPVDRFVRLGDVADLEGDPGEIARLARLILVEAPHGRQPMQLARRDIESRLGQLGLRDTLRWRGAERVRILPAGAAGRADALGADGQASSLPDTLVAWTERNFGEASHGANASDFYAPAARAMDERAAESDSVMGLLAASPATLSTARRPRAPELDESAGLSEIYFTAHVAGAPLAIQPPQAAATYSTSSVGHAVATAVGGVGGVGDVDGLGGGRVLAAGDYLRDPLSNPARRDGVPAASGRVAGMRGEAAGPRSPEEGVRQAVERHLRGQYPGDNVEIAVFVRELRGESPATSSLTFSQVLKGKFPGSCQALLRGVDADGRAVEVLADIEAIVDVPGLVLARPFEKGQNIRAADLRVEACRVVPGAPAPLSRLPEKGVWVASRRLTAGKPLTGEDVYEPFAVSRNEVLSVECGPGEGWSIRCRALALEDGRLGERIAAREVGGEKRWLVEITGPGRATFLGAAEAPRK